MAVVVEQTIPFSPSTLNLESSSRWNDLFPLLRPSVRSIPTSKGQTILADMAKAKGKKYMHIIAVGSAGNFSSKLLDDKHVTAIVTEQRGAGILTAPDIPHALQTAGIDIGPGIVMVRVGGGEREVKVHEPGVLEVRVEGELEQDHLLHLLGTATGGTRANPHNMVEMIKNFIKGAKTARSTFHTEKADGNPAVLHADGARGFTGVREAVARDLETVTGEDIVKEIKEGGEEVVYSVHFSDVNGLSRLENYILAGEIGGFLDSKSLPFALSHSTILNNVSLARGFAISICPIPSHFLGASPKPQPHDVSSSKTPSVPREEKATSSPSILSEYKARIETACKALISAEPTITHYDTLIGDGDCGYTLRDGAQKVLKFLETPSPSLSTLVHELEISMGGTSGALYCIFLTALSNSLPSPSALSSALSELCKYTNARVGDRTMMDVLIPFIESLGKGEGEEAALEKAREGMEGTKNLDAKLGRSAYLDENATKGVPDPGAYGLLVLLEGMVKG